MKVKELIKLLQEENPEATLYMHSYECCMDAFKFGGVKRGFANNDDFVITHSEWAYDDEVYAKNDLSIPVVILEEEE